MNPDERAAMERLRIYKQSPHVLTWTQGDYTFGPCKVMADMELLSDAFLREHPEGGELPVTEEWLESIGFRADSMSLSLLIPPSEGGAIIEMKATPDAEPGTGWTFSLLQGYPDDASAEDDHIALTSLPSHPTRADVLRLLRALKIEVKQ